MTDIFVSFLIPTRKRENQCIYCIEEIVKKSKYKTGYEFLLAFDEDDETKPIILEYLKKNKIPHKYIVTERYGYHALYNYYNKLCDISSGKYLWCWNDDAFILTENWDEILRNGINQNNNLSVYIFKCNDPYDKVAPLIPKEIIEYIGYISLNTHFDNWIESLILDIIPYVVLDIDIFHNDKNHNPMQIDYTEVKQSNSISSPLFFTPEIQNIIQEDREKLKKLVAFKKYYDNNIFVTFTNVPNAGYYIKHKLTGLGNMLFQIASGLSYALKYNSNLNIMDIQHYLLTEEIDINNHILRKFNKPVNYEKYEIVKYNTCGKYSNEEYIFDHAFQDNINFNNYFENYRNFEEIKHLIMYCFSPNKKDIEYILSKYPMIINNDICSIHIRMGPDYNTIFGHNSEYIRTLKDNYIKSIDHMISDKNIRKFFVFTNDKEYSMSIFADPKYKDIQLYYSDERDYVDIWMISLIKNNIVSVSTLSWWGSYLNKNQDKYIVCCDGNRNNLHYPGWIVL